jgi:hypothetical protein
MKSQQLTKLKPELELDLQLVASELDCTASDLRYFHSEVMTSIEENAEFMALSEAIKETGEVTSLDDNTVLYEFLDQPVLIHKDFVSEFIIFDRSFISIYNAYKVGEARDFIC